MARPKKNPDYNSEELSRQVIEAVADMYLNPPEYTADSYGRMQLNLLAEEFGLTPLKIRKLLVTSGAYESATSIQVNNCTVAESLSRKFRKLWGYLRHRSAAISPIRKPYITL